jgi:hypothetical protein
MRHLQDRFCNMLGARRMVALLQESTPNSQEAGPSIERLSNDVNYIKRAVDAFGSPLM